MSLPLNRVVLGECLQVLQGFPDESVDCMVTDPPYGLEFMGREWDKAVPSVEVWKECLRILKSGSFTFIMSSPRLDCLGEMARRLQEAGFETCFTPIFWAYACLSEDTEVLTPSGWKNLDAYLLSREEILCYESSDCSLFWSRPSDLHTYQVAEQLFRIISHDTDQLVSRNHHVFTSRGLALAESLSEQEDVAYLSSLPEGILHLPSVASERTEPRSLLFNKMPSEDKYQKISSCFWQAQTSCVRRTKVVSPRVYDGCEELGVEGRSHIFQDSWKLSGRQIYSVPDRPSINGTEGWLCDGAPGPDGPCYWTASPTLRSSSSYQPQSYRQQARKSRSFSIKQGAQALRVRTSYQTTLATIRREFYSGRIYCPTVSSGIFIAQRNGKIFLTGNSGFPKALNIAKSVDKKLGVESKVIGVKSYPREGTTPVTRKATSIMGNSEGVNVGQNSNFLTEPTSFQAKSLNGAYAGFQPKPAVEVIIVAMKPLSEKTYVEQALKNGKGVTWLDEVRIPYAKENIPQARNTFEGDVRSKTSYAMAATPEHNRIDYEADSKGRFPGNLLVSDDALNNGEDSDSQGHFSYKWEKNPYEGGWKQHPEDAYYKSDAGSFSRYFDLDKWWQERLKKLPESARKTFPFLIVPKASKSEREQNLDSFPEKLGGTNSKGYVGDGIHDIKPRRVITRNVHPTVKPLKLMSYLVTLGSREGDIVLDPFIGSGTTAIACEMLNRRWIGVEINGEYVKIAEARIKPFQTQGKLM